ncbi:hypothetical protein DPMN_182184 [Dreissena polymorpha]|uniref:Uncharacterized protein n=1 Tax=Dreissena polymorpha TaxID=45954 RepID=A0A9D4DHL9_DREPO|nr:hypothetical protein DPMN_182184 [Dreissena polymorpha]
MHCTDGNWCTDYKVCADDKGCNGDKGCNRDMGCYDEKGCTEDRGCNDDKGLTDDKGCTDEKGLTHEKGCTYDKGITYDKGCADDKGCNDDDTGITDNTGCNNDDNGLEDCMILGDVKNCSDKKDLQLGLKEDANSGFAKKKASGTGWHFLKRIRVVLRRNVAFRRSKTNSKTLYNERIRSRNRCFAYFHCYSIITSLSFNFAR